MIKPDVLQTRVHIEATFSADEFYRQLHSPDNGITIHGLSFTVYLEFLNDKETEMRLLYEHLGKYLGVKK
jgi:hypothetical protein